jgi:hypothetical protein
MVREREEEREGGRRERWREERERERDGIRVPKSEEECLRKFVWVFERKRERVRERERETCVGGMGVRERVRERVCAAARERVTRKERKTADSEDSWNNIFFAQFSSSSSSSCISHGTEQAVCAIRLVYLCTYVCICSGTTLARCVAAELKMDQGESGDSRLVN